MALIAVDPGKSGAIAIISGQEIKELHDMPVTQYGSKTLPCPEKFTQLLVHAEETYPGPLIVVCEQVGSSPEMGNSSAFNFGCSFFMVPSVAAGYGVPCYTIMPTHWKRYHGLIGKNKEASRKTAIEKYPHLKDQLKYKKDVDKAEAALIGTAWMAIEVVEDV